MVLAEFEEAFVEGLHDDVVVVDGGEEGAVEERFELERAAGSSELEVAEPQVVVGEAGVEPGLFERGAVVEGDRYRLASCVKAPRVARGSRPGPRRPAGRQGCHDPLRGGAMS